MYFGWGSQNNKENIWNLQTSEFLFKDVPKTFYSIFLSASLSLCFSSQIHLQGIDKKTKGKSVGTVEFIGSNLMHFGAEMFLVDEYSPLK